MTDSHSKDTQEYPFVDAMRTDQPIMTNEPPDGPEIVVNGEVVGYGMDGMAAALAKMLDG